MTKRLTYYALIACAIVATACSNPKDKAYKNTTTSGLATIFCDNSFQNIMEQEIEVFEYSYPDANIVPYYVDEKSAIDSLLNLSTSLIVTEHQLNADEIKYMKVNKGRNVRQQRLAVDAIALIVNNANQIEELSMQDIRDIFSGAVKRWGEIEPTNLKNDSIIVVFDHNGSSIYNHIRDSIAGGKPFLNNVYAQANSAEVFKAVEKYKNAVGLIGVSWVTTDMRGKDIPIEEKVKELNEQSTTTLDFTNKTKVLSVRYDNQLRGKKPYQAYIFDGSYPLFRSIYVITVAGGGSLSSGFYSYLTGFVGQKIIQNTGVLPAAIQPRFVEVVK